MKRNFGLLLILLSITFLSCSKSNQTGILVNFVNRTGAPITQATANLLFIGSIGPDGASGFKEFQTFGTDTGMPDVPFTGTWNQRQLEATSKFYWCGTQKSQLQPGRYTVEVTLVQQGSDTYFNLQFR